jgi:hypothetical protein
MSERRVVANGLLERLVHVTGKQPNLSLLSGAQRVEPALERLAAATVADPEEDPGFQVADDGDELLFALVSAPEPFFVDTDLAQGSGRLNPVSTSDSVQLGAANRVPAQAPLGGNVNQRHGEGVQARCC